MPGVRIVTDSSCDLPPELVAKHQITVVPLTIRFGEEEFVDLEGLAPEEFWAKSASFPGLPETAAPAPGAFRQAFVSAAEGGADGVVCVTISSGLSATYQSAVTAASAGDLPIPVEVVDSRFVTLALGLVVLSAAEAAGAGAPISAVRQAASDAIGRVRALATLDTLENLKRGGRIGGAQAFLASMLSIKPVIHLVDGVVEPESRQRTRSRALAYIVETMASKGSPEVLGIAHGDAVDLDGFVDQVSQRFPDTDLIVSKMGAVLGTHVGKGCVALVCRLQA
jgi:DegV family protein with EDD domain